MATPLLYYIPPVVLSSLVVYNMFFDKIVGNMIRPGSVPNTSSAKVPVIMPEKPEYILPARIIEEPSAPPLETEYPRIPPLGNTREPFYPKASKPDGIRNTKVPEKQNVKVQEKDNNNTKVPEKQNVKVQEKDNKNTKVPEKQNVKVEETNKKDNNTKVPEKQNNVIQTNYHDTFDEKQWTTLESLGSEFFYKEVGGGIDSQFLAIGEVFKQELLGKTNTTFENENIDLVKDKIIKSIDKVPRDVLNKIISNYIQRHKKQTDKTNNGKIIKELYNVFKNVSNADLNNQDILKQHLVDVIEKELGSTILGDENTLLLLETAFDCNILVFDRNKNDFTQTFNKSPYSRFVILQYSVDDKKKSLQYDLIGYKENNQIQIVFDTKKDFVKFETKYAKWEKYDKLKGNFYILSLSDGPKTFMFSLLEAFKFSEYQNIVKKIIETLNNDTAIKEEDLIKVYDSNDLNTREKIINYISNSTFDELIGPHLIDLIILTFKVDIYFVGNNGKNDEYIVKKYNSKIINSNTNEITQFIILDHDRNKNEYRLITTKKGKEYISIFDQSNTEIKVELVKHEQTKEQTQTQTKGQTKGQSQAQTKGQTQTQTKEQTQTKGQTETQTKGQTETQTKGQTKGQTKEQTQTQTKGQTETQTKGQTKGQSQAQTKGQTQTQTKEQTQTKGQTKGQTKEQTQTQTKKQGGWKDINTLGDEWSVFDQKFKVHNVPADGSCQFHAIALGLGDKDITAEILRNKVADRIENDISDDTYDSMLDTYVNYYSAIPEHFKNWEIKPTKDMKREDFVKNIQKTDHTFWGNEMTLKFMRDILDIEFYVFKPEHVVSLDMDTICKDRFMILALLNENHYELIGYDEKNDTNIKTVFDMSKEKQWIQDKIVKDCN